MRDQWMSGSILSAVAAPQKICCKICKACLQNDFLKLDMEAAEFSTVDAVLLDPSCSGSGTAHTQLDQLLSPSGIEGIY